MLTLVRQSDKATGVNTYKCSRCSNTLHLTKAYACAGKACYFCYPRDHKHFLVWLSANMPLAKVIQGEVTGRLSKVVVKFSDCKHTWECSPNSALKRVKDLADGYREYACPTCQKEKVSNVAIAKTLTRKHRSGEIVSPTRYDSPKQYIKDIAGQRITLAKPLPKEVRVNNRYKHECLDCGYEFANQPSNVLSQKSTCPRCVGNIKKTTESYSEELDGLGSRFLPAEEYLGSRTPIWHKSTCCDLRLRVSPTNMLKPKYYSRCPNCEGNSARNKIVALGKRKVKVEGFEPIGIDFLLNKGVKASSIKVQSDGIVPSIEYKYQGWHTHYPDIYIEDRNLLVEVKSPVTLGLTTNNKKIPQVRHSWYKVVAKYKAAKRLGYKYSLLVFLANGERIVLPKNWAELSYQEIRAYLKARYPHLL